MQPAYAPSTPPARQAGRVASIPAPITAHGVRHALFQGRGWKLFRLVVDASALVLGNLAALIGAPAADAPIDDRWLIWLLPPIACVMLAVWRMYADRFHLRLIDGLGQLVAATSLGAISLIAAAALFQASTEPVPIITRAWLFGTIFLIGGRILLAWAARRARAARLVGKPTLIVGAGVVGAHVERRLETQPELGLIPMGYLDSDPPPADMVPDRHAPLLGGFEDLGRVAQEAGAGHVVLAFSSAPDRLLLPLVRECEARGLEVSLVPRMFDSVNVRVALDHLGGLPLYGLHTIDPKGWEFAVKHVLDRTAAALGLLVISPLLLTLALLTKLSSPGPVLFRQRRIGRDSREFEMLKFRSMRLAAPHPDGGDDLANVMPLPSDIGPGGVEGSDRRTAVGTFMRRTSLDELPQLLNVLRGDMSLIGPRPERPEFVDLYGPRINRYTDRHRVKSGITGWAQVHGLRGKTSLRDRVEWDNYYIENWSLGLDFKILLMTIGAFFHRAE